MSEAAGDISCPVCYHNFNEAERSPRQLPCLHTICLACLIYISDATGSLACPLDRKVVHLGHEGASGLPVDFLVTDQMRIEDARRQNKNPMCFYCKRTKRPATHFCPSCQKYTCDVHSEDHIDHHVLTVEEHQKIVAEGKISLPRIAMCKEHNEPVEVYCKTHSKPVCARCCLLSHQKCDRVDIKEVYQADKRRLLGLVNIAREKAAQFNAGHEKFQTVLANLNEQEDVCRGELNDYFNGLIFRLQARQKVLMTTLAKSKKVKEDELTSQSEALRDAATTISKTCHTIERMLVSDYDVKAVSMAKHITRNLEQFRALDLPLEPLISVDLTFVPNTTSGEICSIDDGCAFGPNCEVGPVGHPTLDRWCQFKVFAKDRKGRYVHRGGEQFKGVLRNTDEKTGESTEQLVTIQDSNDGTYTILYQLSTPGSYELSLTLHDLHVGVNNPGPAHVPNSAGSPYQLTAQPNFLDLNFNTCGALGSFGPTQLTGYSQLLLNQVTVCNGVQRWVVPFTGRFRIVAQGAAGGVHTLADQSGPGLGALVSGEFQLQQSEIIHILVGQRGEDFTPNPNKRIQSQGGGGGGGGATFVVRTRLGADGKETNLEPLIVAGGGNGGNWPSWQTAGPSAQARMSTLKASDCVVHDPDYIPRAGGGAGLLFAGHVPDNSSCVPAQSFTNGGLGGSYKGYGGNGGFGGGGGSNHEGGGGGGWVPGSVVPENKYNTSFPLCGSVSYCSGAKASVEMSNGAEHGQVLVTVLESSNGPAPIKEYKVKAAPPVAEPSVQSSSPIPQSQPNQAVSVPAPVNRLQASGRTPSLVLSPRQSLDQVQSQQINNEVYSSGVSPKSERRSPRLLRQPREPVVPVSASQVESVSATATTHSPVATPKTVLHPFKPQPKPKPNIRKRLVIASGSFKAMKTSQMSFSKGDVIEVLATEGKWHRGVLFRSSIHPLTGEALLYPSNFVRSFQEDTQPPTPTSSSSFSSPASKGKILLSPRKSPPRQMQAGAFSVGLNRSPRGYVVNPNSPLGSQLVSPKSFSKLTNATTPTGSGVPGSPPPRFKMKSMTAVANFN